MDRYEDLKGDETPPGFDEVDEYDEEYLEERSSLGGRIRQARETSGAVWDSSAISPRTFWFRVLAALALVGVGAVVLVVRFGADPDKIVSGIEHQLGIAPDPLPARFLAAAGPTSFRARIDGQEGTVRLVGLRVPVKSCPEAAGGAAWIERKLGSRPNIVVSFTKLGRQDGQGHYLGTVGSLGKDLIAAGLASVNPDEAKQSGQQPLLSQAEASAQRRHLGQWSC